MIEVNSSNFQKEVLEKNLVVVDFWASWCEPCKSYTPTIEEVEKEMPTISFVSVKVDDNRDLARTYRIMSVPTVLIFKGGARVGFVSGVNSKEQLKEAIKKYM